MKTKILSVIIWALVLFASSMYFAVKECRNAYEHGYYMARNHPVAQCAMIFEGNKPVYVGVGNEFIYGDESFWSKSIGRKNGEKYWWAE